MEVSVFDQDLRGLATGEVVVAFVPRGAVGPGDEVGLRPAGPRPASELKAAYRHWSELGPPAGTWTALVEQVQPARSLAGEEGHRRHILATVPDGDVAILRVYGGDEPVLSDAAFQARRYSVEAAFQ